MPKKYKNIVEWLDESNVIASSVGWVIAMASNSFIDTLVKRLVIDPINTHTGQVNRLKITKGRYTFVYGEVLEKFINLVIVAFISFMIIRYSNRILGWT